MRRKVENRQENTWKKTSPSHSTLDIITFSTW